jgi:hypothetical protein
MACWDASRRHQDNGVDYNNEDQGERKRKREREE